MHIKKMLHYRINIAMSKKSKSKMKKKKSILFAIRTRDYAPYLNEPKNRHLTKKEALEQFEPRGFTKLFSNKRFPKNRKKTKLQNRNIFLEKYKTTIKDATNRGR